MVRSTLTTTVAAAAAAPASRDGPGPLHGVVPPMVTPLDARQRVDVEGLERLVEHIVRGAVHGLFILGTTGEAAALDDDVRRDLVKRTCNLVAGRVPVLVGVTSTRVPESLRMARFAADCGANAAVISTPFYLPLEQQELVDYVETVVAQQPLPCYLYNIPQLTKTAYEPATVLRLSELPNVIGLKDSSGDLGYLQQLQKRVRRPDWSFFVGTESQLADAVMSGSHGCVGGGANLDPKLFVSLYAAARAGDLERIASLQARLMMLDRIYRLASGTGSIIRGLKCALRCLGICGDHMGAPLRACTAAERRTIEQYLEELGLLTTPVAAVAPGVTSARGAAAPKLAARTATAL
jgi:4-hydroxy-tetrahydrodipicolinate synthase